MSRTAEFTEEFVRVSRGFPCPQCGRDKWCVVHRSGEYGLCQRVETDKRCGDAGWRYEIEDPIEPPEQDVTPSLSPAELSAALSQCQFSGECGTELASDLGVSLESLVSLGLGWCRTRKAHSFPMRAGSGHLVGLQFRSSSGSKWSLAGGRLGLFLPEWVHVCEFKPLFVVEGASDCAALLDCRLSAIGRPACHFGVRHVAGFLEWQASQPKQLVVVADNDSPGIRGAKEFAAEFDDSAVLKPRRHKDARETIVDGGGRRHILNALEGKQNEYWELLSAS